jgi:hypothetical protein
MNSLESSSCRELALWMEGRELTSRRRGLPGSY